MYTAIRNGLRARLPDLGVALSLIAGFWLFYLATVLIRMALVDEDFRHFGDRLLGAAGGAFLTFLLYLVLRRAAGESMRIQVIAAALACVPAATIFSTFNLAFYVHQPGIVRITVSQRGEPVRQRRLTPEEMLAERRSRVAAIPDTKETRIRRWIAEGIVTWYFFFGAWAALYLAISSAAQLRTAERRASRAEREAHEAQLRALRYQVNPHFLFNTLNSLSSLVMARRAEEAESMIVNLSTFFRSSLALDPAEDVTLDEEIGFQRLYLDIEKVRFPNRLRVETDIPAALASSLVPPLLLQPIVENAIKHGVARSRDPVTVAIRAREEDGRLILIVENDGAPADPDREERGTGVGIINVCERLAARYGDQANCEHGPLAGGGYRVTVSLPLTDDGPVRGRGGKGRAPKGNERPLVTDDADGG